MEQEVREKMKDGKGEVEILHIFKKDELKGKVRLFAKIRLNENCTIGYHAHNDEEEIFYVLKGAGRITENGTSYIINTGDAVLTGDGKGHSVENPHPEPLELLAVILLYDR